jgi:hypothetical protein
MASLEDLMIVDQDYQFQQFPESSVHNCSNCTIYRKRKHHEMMDEPFTTNILELDIQKKIKISSQGFVTLNYSIPFSSFSQGNLYFPEQNLNGSLPLNRSSSQFIENECHQGIDMEAELQNVRKYCLEQNRLLMSSMFGNGN